MYHMFHDSCSQGTSKLFSYVLKFYLKSMKYSKEQYNTRALTFINMGEASIMSSEEMDFCTELHMQTIKIE